MHRCRGLLFLLLQKVHETNLKMLFVNFEILLTVYKFCKSLGKKGESF